MVTSQVIVFDVTKWLRRGLVAASVILQNKAAQKAVRSLEFEASNNRQDIRVQESQSWHRQWFLWKRSLNQQRCYRRRSQWIHEGNVSSRLRRWPDSVNRRLYERGRNIIFFRLHLHTIQSSKLRWQSDWFFIVLFHISCRCNAYYCCAT